VIGGLFTSTVLSLLVVPVVFEIMDDVEHWLRRMGRKIRHPRGSGEAPAAAVEPH
ncbi:MAG: transporter, partial [Ramlibacter sp.]|nr:transporter [Ramlibacter sp.]